MYADDFNRDSGPLGSLWATVGTGPMQIEDVVGNGVVVGGTTGSAARWYRHTEGPQFSQATYKGGHFAGVAVCMPGFKQDGALAGGGTWYVFRQEGAGGGVTISQKNIGATTYTALASSATNLVGGNVIRLDYTSGVLHASLNGALLLTHTPASPILGQHYVGFAHGTSTEVTFFLFDDWSGGTPATSPVIYTRAPEPILYPFDNPYLGTGWDTAAYSGWGGSRDGGTRLHRASDLIVAAGTPVYCPANGVIDPVYMPGFTEAMVPGSGGGYQLRVDTPGGVRFQYDHFGPNIAGVPEQAFAPGIVPGASVTRGQLLGWSGSSGDTDITGPHLHVEIRDLLGVVDDDPTADWQATLGSQNAARWDPMVTLLNARAVLAASYTTGRAPRVVLPEVYLSVDGAPWPPATDRTPAGVAEVGDWEMDRELVATSLPGQVRAGSGLSIGSASAAISQRTPLLTPWAESGSVTVGETIHLYAVEADGTTHLLGDWLGDPVSGALLEAGLDLDLIEKQYQGRTVPNLLPGRDNPAATPYVGQPIYTAEAIGIVDVLARQVGYHATPAPVSSTVLSVPFVGSLFDEGGNSLVKCYDPDTLNPVPGVTSWGTLTGIPGPAQRFAAAYAPPLIMLPSTWYYTLDLVGTIEVRLSESWKVAVTDDGTFTVEVEGHDGPYAGAWVPGADPTHPLRVQVECRDTAAPTGPLPNRHLFTCRLRSSTTAAWGAEVTAESPTFGVSTVQYEVEVACYDAASSVTGFQVTTAADPLLWAAPTADLELLGGIIPEPYLPGDVDCWTGIQQVCSAWLGATWVGLDRVLRCRSRWTLAGVGAIPPVLDVADDVEDISWSLSVEDTADRLEVTYIPPDVETANAAGVEPVLWQAEDVVEVKAGATVDVVANLDAPADLYHWGRTWVPAWDADTDIRSVWGAMPNRDGSGVHPNPVGGVEPLTVTVKVVSVGRVIISVHNNTAATLYTVGANGDPALLLRSARIARLANTVTVSRGVAAADSLRTVTVDLSWFVQRTEDVEALADFIWARVARQTWKADSVRVALDWTRDLGDIVQLVHADTDLAATALVTKVGYDGGPGEVAQNLDLVLLWPT